MIFNPDVSKQAQEVVFSRKGITTNHATVYFNNDPVIRENFQKHFGLFLDSKLNSSGHINEKIKKATKSVNVIRKINLSLPRSSLLTLYKSFVRQHLDNDDVIYDQPNNSSLSDKIESVQYNTVLAITGAIRGTSKKKLYQELGLQSLRNRRWLRRMFSLYKNISTKSPPYLYELTLPLQRSHRYLVVLKLCVAGLKLSGTHFYRLLQMNGIDWILILRTVILIQFSAKNFWLL